MHHHEILTPRRPPIDLARLKKAAAEPGSRTGFTEEVRRAETPYVIDCFGLSEEHLGQQASWANSRLYALQVMIVPEMVEEMLAYMVEY